MLDKWENKDKWKCDFVKCVNGLGLAGMGSCPGDPFIETCPNFMTEEEAFELWWPDRIKEKYINLHIITTTGEFSGNYLENVHVYELKLTIMKRMGIDITLSDKYEIVYNGNTIREDRRLKDCGLPDGAKIILEPEPAMA